MDKLSKVVLLCGAAGSGKDTAADAIIESFGFVRHGRFSAELKKLCASTFGWDYDKLGDLEYKSAAGTFPDGTVISYNEDGTPKTRRQLLHYLGTDVFRDGINERFWVIKTLQNMQETDEDDVWLVSDCRFPNEYQEVCDAAEEVFVLQLVRTDHDIPESDHPAENMWKQIPYDKRIEAQSGELDRIREEAVEAVWSFVMS